MSIPPDLVVPKGLACGVSTGWLEHGLHCRGFLAGGQDLDPNIGQPANSTSSSGGGITIGLWDDIAISAGKIAMPIFKRLPVVGKALVGAGLAGAFADHLIHGFEKYDAPPGG